MLNYIKRTIPKKILLALEKIDQFQKSKYLAVRKKAGQTPKNFGKTTGPTGKTS